MSLSEIAYVNVSSANIYRQPTFHCEVDTQAILWEKLEIINKQNDFFLVITEDQYKGWINLYQVVSTNAAIADKTVLITEAQVSFYTQPNLTAQKIRDGFAGIQIPVLDEKDGWIKTYFPDSAEGWIEKKNIGSFKNFNRDELINYANSFLGIPYLWGGKTVKGFDCSGYIQFIHKMFNINLRRDAWMQFEDSQEVSIDPNGGNPGDLMFFAEGKKKITHVGFCFEQGILLHCRGIVKINSLKKGVPFFDEKLLKDFVEIRTFLV